MKNYTDKQFDAFEKHTGLDCSKTILFNGKHVVTDIEIETLWNRPHPYRHVTFHCGLGRITRHFNKLSNI